MGLGGILPGVIGGASSLIGSLFGNPSQKSTSTTKGNYDPSQINLLQQIWAQYSKALGMGTDPAQSDINAMATGVNQQYAGLKDTLESSLTARGYGTSGKVGQGFRQIDESRIGAQQQGRQALNAQALQRYLSLLFGGQGVVGSPLGGTTTTSVGTGSPGFGQAIGGIGGDISTLLLLKQLGMFGGGGGTTNPLPGAIGV